MEKLKNLSLSKFDSSEYLDTNKKIAIYLNSALQDNDPSELIHALGVIAKARGMTEVAQISGISREALYRALNSNSYPRFDTIFRVVRALGLDFSLHLAKENAGRDNK